MKYFYAAALFLIRFDLAIARSTGRNPANIMQLSAEESEYEYLLWKASNRRLV